MLRCPVGVAPSTGSRHRISWRNMKKQELSGREFGSLVVISPAGMNKHHNQLWNCRCVCGKEKVIAGGQLCGGKAQSCGCQKADLLRKANTTHGAAGKGRNKHPTYRVWGEMIRRCESPNSNRYYSHGARGISVCERWHDYAAFMEDMGPRPEGHTLDRINNDGNYEPTNCQWIPAAMQARNKQNTLRPEYNGVVRPLTEWCEILGIKRSRLYHHYRTNGLPFAEAVAICLAS